MLVSFNLITLHLFLSAIDEGSIAVAAEVNAIAQFLTEDLSTFKIDFPDMWIGYHQDYLVVMIPKDHPLSSKNLRVF